MSNIFVWQGRRGNDIILIVNISIAAIRRRENMASVTTLGLGKTMVKNCIQSVFTRLKN